MATPITKRPTIRVATSGAAADTREPMMKVAPPAMLVGRRPTASAAAPPSSAPASAPSVTIPTTSPCAAAPRWNSGMMKRSAPEITPVSKPKRRPPSAAISVISVAYDMAPGPGAGCGGSLRASMVSKAYTWASHESNTGRLSK